MTRASPKDFGRFYYKIRRISDGLYSKGGITPKFHKVGKMWSGLGPIKNHFNCIKEFQEQNAKYVKDIINYPVAKFGYTEPIELMKFELIQVTCSSNQPIILEITNSVPALS